MNKITPILLSLIIFLTTGCFLGERVEKKISVSFTSSSEVSRQADNPGSGKAVYKINPLLEDSYFKTERQQANRGSLIGRYTPEFFILDIDYLRIYKNITVQDLSKMTQTPEEAIIPKHINLIHADNFIRDATVTRSIWEGLSMQFLPGAMASSNDGYYVMSMVGVDLGPENAHVIFPGEITHLIDPPVPGLHYFSFDALQPYATTFLSYLTIGSDITVPGIQNPLGEYGSWAAPGTNTSGNSSQLFFPGPEIDFTPYINPKLIFHWDMENLIEMYDGGVDDLSRRIVTFNLSSPFPVSLILQEKESEPTPLPEDDTPPGEVLLPAISGPSTYNTIQWINPKDRDFDKVVIVRKSGSSPANHSDGEIVYEGYEPNYCDSTGISGIHYYYLIYTVDFSGNYSTGVHLDQVQH